MYTRMATARLQHCALHHTTAIFTSKSSTDNSLSVTCSILLQYVLYFGFQASVAVNTKVDLTMPPNLICGKAHNLDVSCFLDCKILEHDPALRKLIGSFYLTT